MIELTLQERKQVQQCLLGNKDLMIEYKELFEKLYEHYMSQMPYGVAKFRDGDADVWILNKLQEEFEWEAP